MRKINDIAWTVVTVGAAIGAIDMIRKSETANEVANRVMDYVKKIKIGSTTIKLPPIGRRKQPESAISRPLWEPETPEYEDMD